METCTNLDVPVNDVPSASCSATATALQADERWGFAGSKYQQLWEAEVIEPASRMIVERAQGERNEALY